MRIGLAIFLSICTVCSAIAYPQSSNLDEKSEIANYIFLEGRLANTSELESATFVVLTLEILSAHGGIDERDVSLIHEFSSALVDGARKTLPGREMLAELVKIQAEQCLPHERPLECAERLAKERRHEEARKRGCHPDETDFECLLRKSNFKAMAAASSCDPAISNCSNPGTAPNMPSPGNQTTNAQCAGGYRDPATGECVPPPPSIPGNAGAPPIGEGEDAAIAANNCREQRSGCCGG